MKVGEIMTSNPACCTPDTSLGEVARLMVENDCGEIPVVDSQQRKKPVGVVTDRDIVVRMLAQGHNPLERTAQDAMTAPATTVTPEMDLDECANIMERKQIRRVPVVDESGRVTGMVSQADIVRTARDRMAAELVREVSEAGQKQKR
ncbi:MAG TPA: CBS domain-containing protein [Vicinamibacterales bacterium]|nr:CBS domain-containing protein [Vicinamibacterales bacterium]